MSSTNLPRKIYEVNRTIAQTAGCTSMPRARRQSYRCRLNVLGSIRVPVVVVKTGVVGVSRSGWSLLPAGAFAGTLLMVERGRPIRRWRAARGGVGDGAGSSAGLGIVEGPIFALIVPARAVIV